MKSELFPIAVALILLAAVALIVAVIGLIGGNLTGAQAACNFATIFAVAGGVFLLAATAKK